MLIHESYITEGCLSGEEALESIENKQPDLILLDILMPGINGFELCKMLKNDIRTRIIPIIIVTGLTDRKEREKALDAGAEDFLTKPIDKFELTARVKSLIRIKSYHDELIKSYR